MKIAETPRRLRRSVVASLCVAFVLVGGALGGLGVGAQRAAAATGHAKHGTTQRIGPLPKSLRGLPGAHDVLFNYGVHLVENWRTRPAPCPGPKGGTLRPKSVARTSVLGGAMRGWCPLHPGDVLMYVPNAVTLTSGSTSLTLPAGAVVTAHDLRTTSGISTGAPSFKVSTAVAKALSEAYTTMQQYDFGARYLIFATTSTGAPTITPAHLPQRLAREYTDPKSPYYGQVARGPAWACTIPRRERRWVFALSGAPWASAAPTFTTPDPQLTSCAASQHYHAPIPGTPNTWSVAQVTPVTGYAGTRWPAGFFVETNRSLTRVYRVWVPWGAELSLNAPWIAGADHYIATVTSGWAELRPASPTATDPRPMQVWQPLAGTARWPSGFIAGRLPSPTATGYELCATPPPAPTIILSNGGEHPVTAPTVAALDRSLCS